jgi:hypothetical protein
MTLVLLLVAVAVEVLVVEVAIVELVEEAVAVVGPSLLKAEPRLH